MASAVKLPEWQVGSLVRVRERDWVVLPTAPDQPEILRLRPLYGSEAETCGIHLGIEGHEVRPASFPLPDPERASDFIAGRLVRDAARLSLRSGAGPFRSLGRVSVRPRPYQFVPLIMALKQDVVRLLIADDVGVGKTIEAGLIAREFLDRGEAERVCVLCPPHLCEQWQRELETKFHIHAEIVRTSTIARLERNLPPGTMNIYQYYPHLVVSIDFAKGERRRHLFLAGCPDFVIVDEAHTASQPTGSGFREQQQRHELVAEVAKERSRHLMLLTATPHSGIEENFLSLLGLLDARFERLSLQNLSERERAVLARHLVQRRRADVQKWLGAVTPFPERISEDATYKLTADYQALFEDVLKFTRETVREPGLNQPRQRVRYWAALSMLRCLMSSPAAAVQAFMRRGEALRARVEDEVDEEQNRRATLDPLSEEGTVDAVPEAAIELGEADLSERDRRRLREFAKRAEEIANRGNDPKIQKITATVADLLEKGFHPIVYCRFIPTANYIAQQLSQRLKVRFPDIHAIAVTGETGGDEERETRVAELTESKRRVLVATDCLSEGINLQEHFDAVVHADLPWNPNRLEQRQGRVDRYGQPRKQVRAVLVYSEDNQIDMVVLHVLIRKAQQIYRTLGVSVPVPVNSETVVQAVIGALFENRKVDQQLTFGFEQVETVQKLHEMMDRAGEREKESRTRFAQHSIRPDEVARELEAMDEVLGDPTAVKEFLREAAGRLEFSVQPKNAHFVVDPGRLPRGVVNRVGWQKAKEIVFDSPPPKEGLEVVGRNHPLVVGLSDLILGNAFGSAGADARFSRSGAAYTTTVAKATTLALLRLRYRLLRRGRAPLFAEEVLTTAFRPAGEGLEWLPANGEEVVRLLTESTVAGNISQQERKERVSRALATLAREGAALRAVAEKRAEMLEESHQRLREQIGGQRVRAEAEAPDILGVYVLLPGGGR